MVELSPNFSFPALFLRVFGFFWLGKPKLFNQQKLSWLDDFLLTGITWHP